VLQVPPGVYVVTTGAIAGFGEARYENVQVVLGKTTQLDIALQVGAATATVDVGASDQPIDTTDSEVSTSLNAQKLELIPKGQDFRSTARPMPKTSLSSTDKRSPIIKTPALTKITLSRFKWFRN